MKSILIHVKNNLLRQSIELALARRNDFKVKIELDDNSEILIGKLVVKHYDILFMDVAKSYPYSYDEREKTIGKIRQLNLSTKIAMYCDSNSEFDMFNKVKKLKIFKMIDAFFYESVDDKYMVAVLETL